MSDMSVVLAAAPSTPTVGLQMVGAATNITSLPVTVNLQLYAGDDFTMNITLTQSDGITPVDLTGGTVTGQVKVNASDATAVGTWTCTTGTPTQGIITASLTNAVMAGLTAASYVYDIQLKTSGNLIMTVVAGIIVLTGDVTRP